MRITILCTYLCYTSGFSLAGVLEKSNLVKDALLPPPFEWNPLTGLLTDPLLFPLTLKDSVLNEKGDCTSLPLPLRGDVEKTEIDPLLVLGLLETNDGGFSRVEIRPLNECGDVKLDFKLLSEGDNGIEE